MMKLMFSFVVLPDLKGSADLECHPDMLPYGLPRIGETVSLAGIRWIVVDIVHYRFAGRRKFEPHIMLRTAEDVPLTEGPVEMLREAGTTVVVYENAG